MQTITSEPIRLTAHAEERMRRRRLPAAAVEAVEDWGRVIYNRGAILLALGRKEVEAVRRSEGLDLSRYEGITLVTSSVGEVFTVYRNRNLRGLRRSARRFWGRAPWHRGGDSCRVG